MLIQVKKQEISQHTSRSPNDDDQYHSHMLVKSFHSDRKRYNNDEDEHAMYTISSLEPVMFLEKHRNGSFSNPLRLSSGPSISTLQNQNTITTLTDPPLPSTTGHKFSIDAYPPVEPTERL